MEPADVLATIKRDVFRFSNYNPSPNYYGYITGGGNQMAILAETLRTALNQNNLKWHSAPANSEIEKIVIRWICEFINYTTEAGGVFCSGGSVANFLNIAVMRKMMCPVDIAAEGMYRAHPMTIYVSEQGHSSIDKALDMLGFGKNYLRKIPVRDDFTVDVDKMHDKITEDRAIGLLPIGIIGIAGTTNSGAVDPLEALGQLASDHELWYMVDAAYGGPAAGTEKAKHLFKGIEMADSVVLNPHKWFYVPFEVSCILVKNKDHLRSTFSMVPDYLTSGIGVDEREDLMDFNLQLTKDFKALKVWTTFKTYGAENLRKAITNDISNAQHLESLVLKSDDFEMLAPVSLSIACFRYCTSIPDLKNNNEMLDKINDAILDMVEGDGRIFFAGTKIHGQTSLRISCTNHRRTNEDIEFLFETLREMGQKAVKDLTIGSAG